MMSLPAVFWLLVVMFGVVGGFRGWAKEILVLFSMVLALFLIYVLEAFVPGVQGALAAQSGGTQFLVRASLVLALAYFGYQTPNLPLAALTGKLAREKLQDWLLGSVLGLVNGYLVIGSLWYYLHLAQYPWPEMVAAPAPEAVGSLMQFLPPKLIGTPPFIFFSVGAAFVFVIVVFL